MKNLLLAVCVAVVAAGASSAVVAKKAQPNIVYILTDDLGYGDLSCYGQEKFQTPRIDELAAEGMKFSQHYSGSTVCAPSRCSLMTGLHTGHTQIRGNKEIQPEGQAPMKAGTQTIPLLLHKAGYTTGMFGKWGLGSPGSTSDPMEHFDEFYGYNCQRQSHTFYPPYLWHKREKVMLDGKTYSFDLILDKALEFISTNKDKPFFCYMSVTIPHAAMHAPKELHDKYRKLYPQFEDKVGKYKGPHVQNPIAAFPAMMEHLDNGVGKVMDLLKELKIDENTLVMFTSDNGPHREGGHDPEFWNSNGELRGVKRDVYEGGVRVPLLVRWPGKIEAGSTSDQISAFWDMMPTFCELADAECRKDTDGVSIVRTLLGKKRQKQHKFLYWEFHPYGGRQAIRRGDWKGVRLQALKDRDGPIELYNVKDDIGETKNIAAQHPEIAEELSKFMKASHVDSDVFPFTAPVRKKPKTPKKK